MAVLQCNHILKRHVIMRLNSVCISVRQQVPWQNQEVCGYKTFFMLNSAEPKI